MALESMMASTDVFIDPFVFVVPSNDVNRSEWESYFERVLQWSKSLHDTNCTTSECAIGAAHEEGVFPTYAVLSGAIRQHRIESYAAIDICNALRVLSEREPFMEARIMMREVDGKILVVPSAVSTRLPAKTSGALVSLLGCLSLKACEQKSVATPTFCTHSLYSENTDVDENDDTVNEPRLAEELRVSGSVDIAVSYDCEYSAPNPGTFSALFEVIQDPILLTPTPDADLASSLIARINEYRKAYHAPETATVRLGDGFVASVVKLSRAGDMALLERALRYAALACANTLQTVSGAKLHAVRTGSAPNAPQLEREDGAKKWRCMVSQVGAGYRLQYWSLPGGEVELAEIVLESVV